MIRTPVLLLLFLPGYIFLFLGCSEVTPNPSPAHSDPSISWVDDAGRHLELQDVPERIIPLAPNLTELLYVIGAGSQIAAVSLADDHPPQIESLPKYSSFPMDFEALVALNPDVLIATDVINNPKDAEQFTSLGMPILYFSFKTWNDIPRAIRKLGTLTGRAEQGMQAADSLVALLRSITDITESTTPVRTLFLIGSDQLYAFGKGNYIHEAIAYAGGESLTASLDIVSPILSEEFVLTSQPDVILGTFKSADQLLKNHPALRNVPAIVNNRVCTIEPSLLLRPGPRLLSGIQEMARCLHPDLFAETTARQD